MKEPKIVIETEDGVFLQPKQPFEQTSLEEVIAHPYYKGNPKTLKELAVHHWEDHPKILVKKSKNKL